MTNLLPCPFCGGNASIPESYPYHHLVFCTSCGCKTDICDTEAEAIAAWNCRIEPDGQLVEIALVDHEENES